MEQERSKQSHKRLVLLLASIAYGCFTYWHLVYGPFDGVGGLFDVPLEGLLIYATVVAFREPMNKEPDREQANR